MADEQPEEIPGQSAAEETSPPEEQQPHASNEGTDEALADEQQQQTDKTPAAEQVENATEDLPQNDEQKPDGEAVTQDNAATEEQQPDGEALAKDNAATEEQKLDGEAVTQDNAATEEQKPDGDTITQDNAPTEEQKPDDGEAVTQDNAATEEQNPTDENTQQNDEEKQDDGEQQEQQQPATDAQPTGEEAEYPSQESEQAVQEVTNKEQGEETKPEMSTQEQEPSAPEPTFDTSEVPPNTATIDPPESKTTATASTAAVPSQPEPEVNPYAPSPEPKYAKDALCTMKLMLMPSAQVHTMRCSLVQTLKELKDLFAKEVKVSPEILMFMFNGKPLDNNITLADLGVGPNGTVQLEITSSDPATPLKPIRPKVEYQMPDVITVRVQSESGELHDVVVEIERATRRKPFLGGYKHKNTEVEYHHASAQTAQKPRPPSNVDKNCRDTQTTEQKHIVQQTTNDMSTQMTKIGVYVSNMADKLVIPGKYTTAEEYHTGVYGRVLTIQKYYRRWLAKRYVIKVRDDKASREEWERQEELRKRKEKEDRIKREFERRMNPKSKEDFDLLYHALEKWRQEELERINLELTGAERKAALCELLDQETQLIASIGRHKLDSDTESKSKQIQSFLEKAAAPKKWKGPDGKNTEMDTPYTIRAQELRDIYNSINMKYLTQDERLDVLLTLKHTVKEHDCKLTQEIIELIDREADLLMRGVKESNLDGLRKRISTLFLQYIKTPTFNPEAARLLKVPQDPSVLRKDIYFCPSCNQYKPSTEFQLSSNSRTVGRCNKCSKIDNDARIRHDYSHYRYMLKTLRRSEQAYADGSQIAFLLQEGDLRYLVENVWNSQSVLSAWEDLYDLVLVRWDQHTEWSPWNCILLTKEEAASHDKLENLDEAYGKALIHKVKHKHTLARNYFSRMPGMAEYMRTQLHSGNTTRGPSVSGKGLSVGHPVGVH